MRRFRITIAQRIWIGFGVLIIFMIIYALGANSAISRNQKINQQITENYSPSLLLLKDLFNSVDESRMLTRSWVFIDKNPESRYRKDLLMIHDKTISGIDESIKRLNKSWLPEQQKSYDHIYLLLVDSLIPMQQEIIRQLPDAESYSNTVNLYELSQQVQEGGKLTILTDEIINELSILINKQVDQIDKSDRQIITDYSSFTNTLMLMTLVLILISVIIPKPSVLSPSVTSFIASSKDFSIVLAK